jgi:hypothetical protein
MRYVLIGYVLTYGTLVGYIAWLARRLWVARRQASERA